MHSLTLSNRTANLAPSGIRQIFNKALELETQNKKIYHLEIGRPFFSPPQYISEAFIEAINNGQIHYGPNKGTISARRALIEFLQARQQVNIPDPEQIIFTSGASEALAIAMLGLLDVGDEVLIPTPAWPHYRSTCLLAGGTPVDVPLHSVDDYQFNIDHLEKAVSAKSKILILNNPSNPTGAYQTVDTQRKLADFARRHNLLILADEIYDNFCYDEKFSSFIHQDPDLQQTIYINGCSKSFSVTGLRIGFLASNPTLIQGINKVRQYLSVCVSTPSLFACEAAFKHRESPDFLNGVCLDFKYRRDLVHEALRSNTNIRLGGLQGAFYAFLEYPTELGPSQNIAEDILDSINVATVPGNVFGQDFNNHLRISYTPQLDDLTESLTRINNYFR